MKKRAIIRISFTIVLVDMLGVGILIPILPLLFTDPTYAYHVSLSPHLGYLLLGALTALYPFTLLIAMPIIGQLSDTFGRKPILAFSLLGTAASYALFAVAVMLSNIPLMFAARALDGLTGGNIAVVQAAIADVSEGEERIRNFSAISAANGVGFILGPVIGAVLSDSSILSWFSAPIPLWFAGIVSMLNMVAVLLLFPETRVTKSKKRIKFGQAFANIKDALTNAERLPLYVTSFLFQSGFAFIITFFGVYLISRFGFGQREIGASFAFVGLLLAATQILVARPLVRKAFPQTIIPYALAAMAAALVGVYFSRDTLSLYLCTVPAAVSAALVLTNLTGLISTISKNREQGSVLGVNSSVQALAQAIPPLFAGIIAAVFAPTTPILFAAATIAAAAIFFMKTVTLREHSSK